MQKTWLKTGINFTMEGTGHDKKVRRSFANVDKDVSAVQVEELARALEMLLEDELTEAQVVTTEQVTLN